MQNFLKIGGGQMSITIRLSSVMERLFAPKHIRPVGIRQWPVGVNTNCLCYAVGCTDPWGIYETSHMALDTELEIGDAFQKRVVELGYIPPRRIGKIAEANPEEFVLAVFGFSNYDRFVRFQGIISVEGDYHVVRREPDGTWVHKPGWYQSPRVVTEADEEEIRRKFDVSKVALFAFEAPSK